MYMELFLWIPRQLVFLGIICILREHTLRHLPTCCCVTGSRMQYLQARPLYRPHLLSKMVANIPLSILEQLAAETIFLNKDRERVEKLPEECQENIRAHLNSAATIWTREKMDLDIDERLKPHEESLQLVIDKYVKAGWAPYLISISENKHVWIHYLLEPCRSDPQACTTTYQKIETAWRKLVDAYKSGGFPSCENFKARATQILEEAGLRKTAKSDQIGASQATFYNAMKCLERGCDACIHKSREISKVMTEAKDLLRCNFLYDPETSLYDREDYDPNLNWGAVNFSALVKDVGGPIHGDESRYQGRLEQARELSRQINAWLEEGNAWDSAVWSVRATVNNLIETIYLVHAKSITMNSIDRLFSRNLEAPPA